MDMIITDASALRDRMRQIKKNREKFVKNNEGVIVDHDAFMSIINKYADSHGKYLASDNPACAFMGVYDIDECEGYYCPIEDLSEEEINKICSLRPQPPMESIMR